MPDNPTRSPSKAVASGPSRSLDRKPSAAREDRRRTGQRFRLWEKKRGTRQTGSKILGGAGEALFFVILFLGGLLALTEILAVRTFRHVDIFLTHGWGLWLCVPVLASLVAIGAAGLIYTAVVTGTSAERRSALAKRAGDLDLLSEVRLSPKDYPTVPRDTNWTNSPGIRLNFRLPTVSSPAWRLVVVTGFCLIWNGVTAVLAVLAINQVRASGLDWYFVGLVTIFGLCGIPPVVYMFHLLVAATAIGTTGVEVSEQPLFPGNDYRVYLTQAGHLTVHWLELYLTCDEEVCYTQGTDIRIERRRVYHESIFRCDGFQIEPAAPFEHEVSFSVPPGAMHSFVSPHNSVHWKFVVSAHAKSWPPFERAFPLVVYPNSRGLGPARE
jgi:hypothetical protein